MKNANIAILSNNIFMNHLDDPISGYLLIKDGKVEKIFKNDMIN